MVHVPARGREMYKDAAYKNYAWNETSPWFKTPRMGTAKCTYIEVCTKNYPLSLKVRPPPIIRTLDLRLSTRTRVSSTPIIYTVLIKTNSSLPSEVISECTMTTSLYPGPNAAGIRTTTQYCIDKILHVYHYPLPYIDHESENYFWLISSLGQAFAVNMCCIQIYHFWN